MHFRYIVSFSLLLVSLSACSDEAPPVTDTGSDQPASDTGPDATVDAGSEAGTPDAGGDVAAPDALDDTGNDAGAPDAGVDAPAADTGTDTGTVDVPPDTGATLVIHGCTVTDYADRTAAGAERTVTFGTAGNAYSPRCLLIGAGQAVTFSGDFTVHPLRPGVAPSRAGDPAGSPGNPILATDSGSSASFTFPAPGTYPFHCAVHEASGMLGAVLVR